MSYLKDLQAAKASIELFKDVLSKKMGGSLVLLEMENERIAKWFDMYSGIDALNIINGQLRGVALRCQWTSRPWDTFTIRYSRPTGVDTEYQKRTAAIFGKSGLIYPYLTVQAYFDDRVNPKLLSFSIIKTEDLYTYITNNLDAIEKKSTKEGQVFLNVPFQTLEKAGCKMTTWKEKSGMPLVL